MKWCLCCDSNCNPLLDTNINLLHSVIFYKLGSEIWSVGWEFLEMSLWIRILCDYAYWKRCTHGKIAEEMFMILQKANKKRRIKFSGCFVCSFLFLLLFFFLCGERCFGNQSSTSKYVQMTILGYILMTDMKGIFWKSLLKEGMEIILVQVRIFCTLTFNISSESCISLLEFLMKYMPD